VKLLSLFMCCSTTVRIRHSPYMRQTTGIGTWGDSTPQLLWTLLLSDPLLNYSLTYSLHYLIIKFIMIHKNLY